MGLLYPGALLFLALIPVLAIAYLVRERPSRVTVSSVLAFRALRGLKPERPWGMPRFDLLFLFEALILSFAALAMAAPYLTRQHRPIAVVLDDSAAMQALMPSGQSRFESARSRLAATLAGEGANTEVTLFVTAPEPHKLAGPFKEVAEARSAIERVKVTDAGADLTAAGRFVSSLLAGGRFAEVIVATDHKLERPAPDRLRTIVAGDAVANFAIGSFVLRREGFGSEILHGRVTIANFSPEAATLKVAISGDGKPLTSGEARLEPREIASIEFPRLAAAGAYKAELKPDDSFALDNLAYATPHAIKAVEILFVTPSPSDAEGLGSLPGVNVTVQSPDEFSPVAAAKSDLVVFEYAVPKEMPATNALLVMPPGGDPVFNFEVKPSSKVQVASWRSPDPLTDGVNFRLLEPHRAEFLGSHPWMQEVISGNGGGLLLVGERSGHRFVATGFNPFPYLGRKNLPMSVLTLNMLSHLAGLGADSVGFRTGERWVVPAGVTKIIEPSGAAVAAPPGTLFTAGLTQGVYQLAGADGGILRLRAVNLASLPESDLQNLQPLIVEAPRAGGVPSFPSQSMIDVYLIGLILALAAIEAVVAYRRRRPVSEAGA